MTELRPEWSDDATDVLNDIMEYLLETFGISSVIKLRDEIDDYVNTLLKNPNAGRVEPFLEGRCYVYRSIVINLKGELFPQLYVANGYKLIIL